MEKVLIYLQMVNAMKVNYLKEKNKVKDVIIISMAINILAVGIIIEKMVNYYIKSLPFKRIWNLYLFFNLRKI